MINISDIAKVVGVAPITVSRVINNSDNVNAVTRDRVQQAIEELHYVPTALVLLLSDITDPFWPTVARSGEDAAGERGFHTISFHSHTH